MNATVAAFFVMIRKTWGNLSSMSVARFAHLNAVAENLHPMEA
jgi:hypothetical protein